jgi:anti-sigma regulatory factor (Ser/Thr protein kinase)
MGTCNGPDQVPGQTFEAATFHVVIPSVAAAVPQAREELGRFLQRWRLASSTVDDVVSAAGEALANSVEHGGRRDGSIEVSARVTGDGVEVRVTDDGRGFRPRPRPATPPDFAAPRGFGIYIMYRLMDEVAFDPTGTSVRLYKERRRSSDDRTNGTAR